MQFLIELQHRLSQNAIRSVPWLKSPKGSFVARQVGYLAAPMIGEKLIDTVLPPASRATQHLFPSFHARTKHYYQQASAELLDPATPVTRKQAGVAALMLTYQLAKGVLATALGAALLGSLGITLFAATGVVVRATTLSALIGLALSYSLALAIVLGQRLDLGLPSIAPPETAEGTSQDQQGPPEPVALRLDEHMSIALQKLHLTVPDFFPA